MINSKKSKGFSINKSSIFILLFYGLLLQGCILGKIVAVPFKVTGALVNTITPDIVGDTISTTGNVIDAIIPF